MDKTHDFVMPYRGFAETGGRCRIRIYEEPGRPPVVICSQLPGHDNTSIANMVEYLAAEVMEEFLPDLTDANLPFVWVNHWPPESLPPGVKEWYSVATFASYEPTMKRVSRPGLWQRITLGTASFDDISHRKLQKLIGARLD